ncbi:MAG: hypothetical protein EOO73_00025 [Myxococcales bacterium]|nr:MAG: hypothetical protein EOO73_00025 [Myxococcales bacterium]
MPHLAYRSARPPSKALCGSSSALILLFTDAWGCPEDAILEALRTELRALSSALLVVGDDELFYLNVRPESDATALAAALESRALVTLRQGHGGAPHRLGGVTLSLLGADGRERFRISRKMRGAVPEVLLEALQIARQSVDLPASFRTFSERELLFYSLVGALNLVLTDVASPEPPVRTAQA